MVNIEITKLKMLPRNILPKARTSALAASVVCSLVFAGYCFVLARKRRQKRISAAASKSEDTVVLHLLMRRGRQNRNLINVSPFAIMLETYMRANGISYTVAFDCFVSEDCLSPWISLDGKDLKCDKKRRAF